jgi:hypothetical protein
VEQQDEPLALAALRVVQTHIADLRVAVADVRFEIGKVVGHLNLAYGVKGGSPQRHRGHGGCTEFNSLCPLCVLCVSVVNSTNIKLK